MQMNILLKIDQLQLHKLGLVEAYKKFKPACPASCFRCRQHIDGIWHKRNIVPTAVSRIPFHFGVRDCRVYVVYFQIKSTLNDLDIPRCSLNKRRLTCSFLIIVQRYLERAEAPFTLHKIPLQIQQQKDHCKTLDPLLIEIRLNRIDK